MALDGISDILSPAHLMVLLTRQLPVSGYNIFGRNWTRKRTEKWNNLLYRDIESLFQALNLDSNYHGSSPTLIFGAKPSSLKTLKMPFFLGPWKVKSLDIFLFQEISFRPNFTVKNEWWYNDVNDWQFLPLDMPEAETCPIPSLGKVLEILTGETWYALLRVLTTPGAVTHEENNFKWPPDAFNPSQNAIIWLQIP
jgi:hypothetical protein